MKSLASLENHEFPQNSSFSGLAYTTNDQCTYITQCSNDCSSQETVGCAQALVPAVRDFLIKTHVTSVSSKFTTMISQWSLLSFLLELILNFDNG